MTPLRLPGRPRNIRSPLLVSAVFHAVLVATLVVASADPTPPRLLRAEGNVLSVSWIHVVPAAKEAVAAPAGRVPPRVSAPAATAPVPERKAPSRPQEERAAPETMAALDRSALAPPAAGTGRTGVAAGSPTAVAPEGPTGAAAATAALPRYRDNARPAYPLAARLRGYEGVVLLSVEVSADGRVGSLAVKRSSGHEILDRSALEAVRTWTFEPARRLGKPVRMRVDVPVKFILSGEDSLS